MVFAKGGAHFPGALLREPALGHAGVPREETLEGLALDAGFGRQRLHRRGGGSQARHAVALLLREGPRAVEHGGLAAAGVALHADHAVLRRQDQLHGGLLPGRERPLVEVPLDDPAPHRRPAAALAGAHRGDGLPFLPDRLRGGERILGAGDVHAVQRPRLLQSCDLALGLRDGDRARRMGERGGEKIGAGEHRLALREMRHRPGHGFGGRRRRFRCVLEEGSIVRIARSAPRTFPIRGLACPLRTVSTADSGLRRLAGIRDRLRSRHRRDGAFFLRVRRQRPRIEPEIGGLLRPRVPELPPVDVALLRPRHQRRPLGKTRTVGRLSQSALGHRRLDLGAPRRECLDDLARHPGDLEAAIGMGSSRCRSRASQDRRQARCGRACRSASGARKGPRWPSSATSRPRPGPCWRARHGCGAGDRGCARCRGGRWRRRSSVRPRAPSGRFPEPAPDRIQGPSSLSRRRSSRSRRALPSPRRLWTSTMRSSPPTRATRETDFGAEKVRSRPGRCWISPSLPRRPSLVSEPVPAPGLRGSP